MNYDEFAILLLLLRCYCVTADWKTLREGYMGFLLEAFRTSIHLILSFDPEIYAIVLRSLEFSLWATVLAVLFGVPAGFLVGSQSFRGKSLLISPC